LNYLLTEIGLIKEYVTFLGDERWVWLSIIVVGTWNWFAFDYVSILAGLQTIPSDLGEAAEIDGANEIQLFRYVTLPLLRPVLAVLVLLEVIWTVRDFATIWTLTEGGPGHFTMTLSPLVYITSFKFFRLGYGASIGMWILLISMVFTIIYLRQVRFEVD
jgi:multiple sugar transport system permease protein